MVSLVLHFSNKVRIELYGFFRGSSKEILHDKTGNWEGIWGMLHNKIGFNQ